LVRGHGLLLIADESFTWFGRTGTMFACEQAKIAPDILCVSKALTGGTMGLAATLASRARGRWLGCVCPEGEGIDEGPSNNRMFILDALLKEIHEWIRWDLVFRRVAPTLGFRYACYTATSFFDH
jgi:glutamate-1-semialdehyde aminotransferase